MINASNQPAIEHALFVRIECSHYVANPGDTPTTEILKFSDCLRNITINSELYRGVGRLMGISATPSELRTSRNEVTITLSGIPNSSISEIINSKIKGSKVNIYRGLYNPVNSSLISYSGNPMGKFTGIVTNYNLSEDFDVNNKTSSNTISLMCASILDVLGNTASGRRTNPEDQKELYPSDVSMDRVPSLVGQYFNFGAPQ